MLFRAIFWIGLVSLLMPREPDLGFGRPHLTAPLSSGLSWAEQAARAPGACQGSNTACSTGVSILEGMQSLTARSLAEVKAEIEESKRERLLQRHTM
jgi:hypothetical protein